MRVLNVSEHLPSAALAARMTVSIFLGFSSIIDPYPFWHTESIGHPMLMSIKSTSIVSSSNWQHLVTESG